MQVEQELRKLAKSNYWQSLYRISKECGIPLFINNNNFSGLQVRFLHYLQIYDMLYNELLTHEDEYLSEAVIDDFDRTDAYLIYRNKKHDFLWKKHRQEERVAQLKSRNKKAFSKEGKQAVIDVDLRRE